MRKTIWISLLILTLATSCTTEEEVVFSEDQEETFPPEADDPLVELQFSDPPIDLQGAEAQFAADVSYDIHDLTKFDIFLPTATAPTPLVVFIHGGGFTSSDKTFLYNGEYDDAVITLLNQGIAVATLNYRLIVAGDQDGVLKSLNDSRRGLQYLRYIHNEINIDKENILLFGASAGAATALWLATNDDFGDADNNDPVLRESTRVKGIALNATQSSLDIETRWMGDVFGEFGSSLDTLFEEFGADTFYEFYGVDGPEAYDTPEIETYRARVDMLAQLSSDDPEIWVTNTGGHNDEPLTKSSFNHHPFHAREIKEFADAVGVPNVTTYGNPILFSDGNEDYVSFLIRKSQE
ncbi:MAG: alpha/beta hydrolase [Flavobacteriaceae bacterium]|nr:alpha/beta hydrolase [Flavobacteriaceae bacterium]